jgi:hypothetical protein
MFSGLMRDDAKSATKARETVEISLKCPQNISSYWANKKLKDIKSNPESQDCISGHCS